jgi:hypothetical protein
VDTPAREGIEARKDHLRTGPRDVRSLPTIRMEDIERPHRKEEYLRYKWMYRKWWFLSSSKLVGNMPRKSTDLGHVIQNCIFPLVCVVLLFALARHASAASPKDEDSARGSSDHATSGSDATHRGISEDGTTAKAL